MDDPGRRVLVGRIAGVCGVRGGVKIVSWTDPRERIFDYQPWFIGRDGTGLDAVEHVSGHRQGQGLVAYLPGVTDRDQAATLVGLDIVIARERLPDTAPGEYYWSDLEALAVVTVTGVALGQVNHVMATGANDVLVVRGNGRERLIPFVPGRYVKEVDLAGGRVVVDWDPDF